MMMPKWAETLLGLVGAQRQDLEQAYVDLKNKLAAAGETEDIDMSVILPLLRELSEERGKPVNVADLMHEVEELREHRRLVALAASRTDIRRKMRELDREVADEEASFARLRAVHVAKTQEFERKKRELDRAFQLADRAEGTAAWKGRQLLPAAERESLQDLERALAQKRADLTRAETRVESVKNMHVIALQKSERWLGEGEDSRRAKADVERAAEGVQRAVAAVEALKGEIRVMESRVEEQHARLLQVPA